VEQRSGDAGSVIIGCDAAKQALTGVGCANPALPLLAIQSNGVGGNVVAPERRFESLSKYFGVPPKVTPALRVPKLVCRLGNSCLSGVYICLHLAKCNGTFCKRTVGMKHGIVRVFPALLDEASGRPAVVLDESVPVLIAVTIDPLERQFD